MASKQPIVSAIIDVGTATTKVLIVELEPALNILGSATTPTEGMLRGEIQDLTLLKNCVHRAIDAAEKQSGFRVRYAVMGITGYGQTLAQPISGMTSVKSQTVSDEDVARAKNDANEHDAEKNYAVVQRISQYYAIADADGNEKLLQNPRGKISKSLKFYLWMIQGKTNYLGELVQIANQYGLYVTDLYAASFASAKATEVDPAHDKNRLVIDIGAGTTDFALFDGNGILAATGVVPVGGHNISRDITVGLHFGNEIAEKFKVNYADAVISTTAENATIAHGNDIVSHFALNTIVHVRVKELFEMVRQALPAGTQIQTVVLTGGTAKLKNIALVASNVFSGSTIQISGPKIPAAGTQFIDETYSTVVGLAALLAENRKKNRSREEKKTWLQILKEFFQK